MSAKTVVHDLVHDPMYGDRLEVFLPAEQVWQVLGRALRHLAADSDPTADPGRWPHLPAAVREVYGCLDPLGMPADAEGRAVWSVPPEPMWTLVGSDPGGGEHDEAAAVEAVRAVLAAEFPELADTGMTDGTLQAERAIEVVRGPLESAGADAVGQR